jgi:hypothetical protein
MHWMPSRLPAAREAGLVVERVEDEIVIFDTETTDAHCLSPLAAIVFEHCDGRTTVTDMAVAAAERLGEPVDADRIRDALDQLEERKLLAVGPRGGMSRRDMMRRSAMVGAAVVSAPVISTIRATPALAGASATCGGFKDISILCCPCGTGSQNGKSGCCTTPFTNQCVCTKAESNNTKYCKPSGVGAQGDTFCQQPANYPCCDACNVVRTDCDFTVTDGVNCSSANCTHTI